MGLLDRIEKRVSLEDPSVSFNDPRIWDQWDFGGPSSSGAKVNARSAHKVGAFYAGVRFISETVASLPIRLYRRTAEGRELVTDDPRVSVWRDLPNPQMSAYTLREVLQGHMVAWGNAYIEVVRDGEGRIREAWPLLPDRTVREFKDGRVSYVTEISPGHKVRLPDDAVVHIPGFGYDGRNGYSLLTMASEALGLSIAAETHAGKFFANGLRPSGILTAPAVLNPQTRKKLKESVEEQAGLSNTQRMLLLEGGITFQQMGMPPGDAQFLEQRQFSVREIARFLNLPPHVLRDLDNATFSNIEQQSLDLVIYSLTPWFRRWEDALKKDMLLEHERSTLFWKIDARGLLRGDSEARMNYFQGRFNTGSMTPNEIRLIEDENPLPGGDKLFVHSAVVPIDQAGQMSATNQVRDVQPGDPLVLDVWQRLCRGEVRELNRLVSRGGSVDDYYAGPFIAFAERTLAPLGGDVSALVGKYAYDARQQLQDLTPEQVSLVLESWTDRAEVWSA